MFFCVQSNRLASSRPLGAESLVRVTLILYENGGIHSTVAFISSTLARDPRTSARPPARRSVDHMTSFRTDKSCSVITVKHLVP